MNETKHYARIDAKGIPKAFYASDVHRNIPPDAIEIPESNWRRHIEGQKQQYVNGVWQDYKPTAEELAAMQAAQQQAVYDAYAAAAQQRITDELKARDYDDEAQLAIYAASAGNTYQAEAQGLIDWITGTVWPAWEALDPATIDPNGAQAWAGELPSPQV